ncbi:MAG: nucleotidyltransferase domain-containing protein [Candidatus Bathyarchaeota archaeon]|nr:nucleotidyltransferase domain-containing protein [Candidatus Bathyarchaeota archaeon]
MLDENSVGAVIERALRRQEAFRNLNHYLKIIKDVVVGMDPDAEVFLFGSVAEGTYTYSSDIDVLIVTRMDPAEVLRALWEAGIKEPFEIHVQTPDGAEKYRERAKLIKV